MWDAAREAKQNGKDRAAEREIVQGHPLDLFPTPAALAADMVQRANLSEGLTILEPSAGTGNIAAAIQQAGYAPQCVELNYSAAELLKRRGYNVICGDFLEHAASYDRVVMNPPFSAGADAEHVKHAYNLLNPGGRIVAIMSPHAFFAQDNRSREFREWIETTSHLREDLPAGTFRASGTMVNACLVIIDK
jgi:predicted RNA methylase